MDKYINSVLPKVCLLKDTKKLEAILQDSKKEILDFEKQSLKVLKTLEAENKTTKKKTSKKQTELKPSKDFVKDVYSRLNNIIF